jgi:hypothetical protein
MKYFLEVDIARDFVEGRIASLGEKPTSTAICRRLIRYAIDDAWGMSSVPRFDGKPTSLPQLQSTCHDAPRSAEVAGSRVLRKPWSDGDAAGIPSSCVAHEEFRCRARHEALLLAQDTSSEEEFLIVTKLLGEIIASVDGLLHESIYGDHSELRKLGKQQ